eukprot:TRINITY_DN2639_c0_g1_i1.p1 TRINITY_DN2639_c0_g1~~TRINITY_DN2639_c0_g1_i1.p1  ORF type:complete len:238 (+),score=38.61 TRINITY_DN2639_c0_g1_i1:54-767(+)
MFRRVLFLLTSVAVGNEYFINYNYGANECCGANNANATIAPKEYSTQTCRSIPPYRTDLLGLWGELNQVQSSALTALLAGANSNAELTALMATQAAVGSGLRLVIVQTSGNVVWDSFFVNNQPETSNSFNPTSSSYPKVAGLNSDARWRPVDGQLFVESRALVSATIDSPLGILQPLNYGSHPEVVEALQCATNLGWSTWRSSVTGFNEQRVAVALDRQGTTLGVALLSSVVPNPQA